MLPMYQELNIYFRLRICNISSNNNNNNNLVWRHCHRVALYKSASHVSLTNYQHPLLHGAFHPTQPHPHARKCKHDCSSTVILWTTTDEFNVIPKTQWTSSTSVPGQYDDINNSKIIIQFGGSAKNQQNSTQDSSCFTRDQGKCVRTLLQ